jgi:hypothetical protein
MEAHQQNHADLDRWRGLGIGQEVMVVKRSPLGAEAARYPAIVVERVQDDEWVALKARWTYKRVEIDGLIFDPGDDLIEWFSPVQPFNAFAVLSPQGVLRGWYANVTYPAFLEPVQGNDPAPTLVWHDLYLDLVGLPDGTFVVRDEDELEESGLGASDSLLHDEIVTAADELVRRFTSNRLPFRLLRGTTDSSSGPRQSQNESV